MPNPDVTNESNLESNGANEITNDFQDEFKYPDNDFEYSEEQKKDNIEPNLKQFESIASHQREYK